MVRVIHGADRGVFLLGVGKSDSDLRFLFLGLGALTMAAHSVSANTCKSDHGGMGGTEHHAQH